MQIHIAGSYISKFGELWDKSLEDLIKEATLNAISDSALEAKEIEAVYIANMASGQYSNQLHLGALVSQYLGHYPPAIRVEAACASGGVAIVEAQKALLSKLYKTVLVIGVEKMTDVSSSQTTQILASAANYGSEYGSTFPGLYAILAQQHMQKYGTTRDQLSRVAVKNHRHALDNDKAQFRRKITVDQVSNSAPVADPLTLLDCSPISDGVAGVILTSKKINKPQILGFGQGQDSLDLASRTSLVELPATKRAVQLALDRARLTIDQIEVAEVHDCFTIAEILAIEDLGFVKKGEGGKASISGQTTYGGKVVINPSGGLKACGHPIGATGVKQVAYIAKLIENNKFKLGLTHNIGGSGATAVVNIIGK